MAQFIKILYIRKYINNSELIDILPSLKCKTFSEAVFTAPKVTSYCPLILRLLFVETEMSCVKLIKIVLGLEPTAFLNPQTTHVRTHKESLDRYLSSEELCASGPPTGTISHAQLQSTET